jgi:hypothetical protein
MLRTATLDAPGALHHIIIQGAAGIGFSRERGESIAKEVIIHLKVKLLNFKRASRFRFSLSRADPPPVDNEAEVLRNQILLRDREKGG